MGSTDKRLGGLPPSVRVPIESEWDEADVLVVAPGSCVVDLGLPQKVYKKGSIPVLCGFPGRGACCAQSPLLPAEIPTSSRYGLP